MIEAVENLVARVNVIAEVFDAVTGKLLDRQETHNLVTNAGLALIVACFNAGTGTSLTHFAVGTGTTAVTGADTALGTEVFRDAFTGKTAGSTSLVCSYYLGSGSANGSTLGEAGLFTASSGGTCYARVVLASTIAKTSSIAVQFTWTLTWGAA